MASNNGLNTNNPNFQNMPNLMMNQYNQMNQLYQSMLLQNQLNANLSQQNTGKNINQFNFNNLNFQQMNMMQNNQLRSNLINSNMNNQYFNMNMNNFPNYPYPQQMMSNLQMMNKQNSFVADQVKSKQSMSDLYSSPLEKKYSYKNMVEYKIRVSKDTDIKESYFFEKLNIELQNKKKEIQKSIVSLRSLSKIGDINTARLTDKMNVLSLSCLTVYDE